MRWQAFKQLWAHYREVFQAAWHNRNQTDFDTHLAHETEFMPAALSLQETPISPKPRYAMWLLIAFAAIGLLWAIFGRIDVVATGQGKVVPSGYSKTIQPLEAATVKSIAVVDGQKVHKGDVLIEFEPVAIDADLARIEQDLSYAQLQVERANALIKAIETKQRPILNRPDGIDDLKFLEAKNLLEAQYAELTAQLQQNADEAQRAMAIQVASHDQVRHLSSGVALNGRRAQDYKKLVEEGFVSRHAYVDQEQAMIDQQKYLSDAQGREREMIASIRQLNSQREQIIATLRKTALESLNEGIQKKNQLVQDLAKAQLRKEQSVLTAPVDGTVQQLAVHTVGGVVTPAQALMMIVPADSPLDIEVFLPNKDIGFIQVGQPVEVKVEAFPYTKYGVIRGVVAALSNDAIVDEKQGLIYAAKITINKEQDKDASHIRLSPGLAVTAQIKTEQRRVIEYFLSPLQEYKNESLKER